MNYKFIILTLALSAYLVANSTNQIIWDGDKNQYDSSYIDSLTAYIKKEMPKKYTAYNRVEKKVKRIYHNSGRSFSRAEQNYYCNNLLYDGYSDWEDTYSSGTYTCFRKEIVYESNNKNNISFFNFLNDKEKISIYVNYLISKKYNLVKNKFERTSSFQKRLQSVKDNIEDITNSNMTIAYNKIYGKPIIKAIDYDADNELFYGELQSENGSLSEKIAINIPLNVAEQFYSAHKEATVIYQYKNEKVYLTNIIVSSYGNEYSAVIRDTNYKPKDIKVALYKQVQYGEKLIKKLQNDIPKFLQKSKAKRIDNSKWLFIVGIENYEYADSVKYSAKSAKEIKTVMKKRLGIHEKNVRTLIDRGATSSKIDYRLKEMLRRVKKGDAIYFYYSGHGIPVPSQNNTPYMLAQDMNPAYLNDERFKLQTIYKELSNSKASKVVAFIDSCFSGGTDNQQLIKGVAATRLKPKKVTFDNSKMVVISAGSGTQYSNKYDEKSNRLFSYYVMRGLINNNTDTQRLYDYVKSNVQEKSYEMGASYEQVPVYNGNIELGL